MIKSDESIEYQTIRQQCRSFDVIPGARAKLKYTKSKLNPHVVKLVYNYKLYNLSDPDPNIIIMQLAKLYGDIKRGAIDNFRT